MSDDTRDGDGATIESEYSGHDERPHHSAVERQRTPYTESQVILATVKIVAPFVFTYGLFVTFHGAGSPGGGFQGGAIMAAVVLMIAFAFGIDSTREWLSNAVVVGLAVGGVVIFAGTGVVTLALGGAFLDYALLPIPDPVKWGMELVEIGGVALIVASVLVGLFFLLAAGFAAEGDAYAADGGRDTVDSRTADGGRDTITGRDDERSRIDDDRIVDDRPADDGVADDRPADDGVADDRPADDRLADDTEVIDE